MITEVAIQKMIEASQKMINEQLNSPPVNEHFKLQIKTLQNAPRDPEKLEQLLKARERQKEKEIRLRELNILTIRCCYISFSFIIVCDCMFSVATDENISRPPFPVLITFYIAVSKSFLAALLLTSTNTAEPSPVE
jgi:hypothetical protein